MLSKKPKGAVQKKQGSGLASLLWMFVGALLTLMAGLFVYLWNPFNIGNEVSNEPRQVQPIEQGSGQTNNQNGDYEFYELLPEQDTIGIPDDSIFAQDEAPAEREPIAVILEPDVVVEAEPNTAQSDANRAQSDSQSRANEFGISEDTILNPLGNQEAVREPASQNDSEIVIVEEEGTYDEPNASANRATTIDNEAVAANRQNQNNRNQNNQSNRTQQSSGSASIESAQPAVTYIVQINSYTTASEADKRRAQVLMAGVDARVVKTTTANGQTYYQVITPPQSNRQNVLLTQQKLQNNGIDSLIVEQRR